MSVRDRIRKFLSGLVSPFGLLTLALIFVCLLIWFVGPLIGAEGIYPLATVSIRLTIILVLVIIWALLSFLFRKKRESEEEALLAALRRQQEEQRNAAQETTANEKAAFDQFRNAARFASKNAHGRGLFGKRDQLPWYLVIGADGAGKTMLVRNSGLTMPYQDEEPEAGALANFHITDQAVFVEAAGRFLETSEQHAAPQWLRVLDYLRRLRGRRTVNGIIVAVSAGDLLALTPESELEFSSILRRRLDEATIRLRRNLPVYLVVTKLDLLVGFEEFFDGLGIEERAAVLGLPIEPQTGKGATTAGFAAGLSDITRRIADQLLFRLQEEPDEQRRRRLNEFPSQFAALGALIEPLVSSTTIQHRFAAAPRLRGLFFTSAAQSSLSVDMLAPALAASFAQRSANLAVHSDGGRRSARPYFVKGMVRDVILPEAGLGALTRQGAMFQRMQGLALNIGLATLAIALAAIWWTGFREGRAYSDRLAAGYEEARASLNAAVPDGQRAASFEPILSALDDLRQLVNERPEHSTFGLYSTFNAEAAARETYTRGIEGLMLPYVWRYLRDDVANRRIPAPLRFEQLKLYLMMLGEKPLDGRTAAQLGPDFAARWLPYDRSEETDARVAGHLHALASIQMPPLLHDEPLIDQARSLLSEYTLARLAYDRLEEMPSVRALPIWRPVDHMGLTGPQALARVSGHTFWDGVRGLYTRDAFFGTVLRASGTAADATAADLWVMGHPDTLAERTRESQRIRDGLLDLYRVEYVRVWDALISDLAMAEGSEAAQVARAMALIIGTPSPARELLTAIAHETDLSRPGGAAGMLAGLAGDQSTSLATTALGGARSADVGAAVATHFEDFRNAIIVEEGQQARVDVMIAALDPLYRQINHIASGGDILELGAAPQATLAQVTEQAAALPLSLQPLFRRIITQAAAVTSGSSRERVSQIWSTTVLQACLATTQGRYPFDPRSNNDASLADFASLFKPGGLIAGFRNDYLRPYIDTSGKPWRWRTSQLAGLNLGEDVLSAFELADSITTAYFGEADTPSVAFTVEPVRLDPRARAFQFDIGGSTLVYTHGPPSPAAFTWPPQRVDADAILSVTPEIQGERSMIRRQGPWALFRLFDAGRITRPDATDIVPYSFTVGTRQVMLNVTAPPTRNPFARDILSDFSCPVL